MWGDNDIGEDNLSNVLRSSNFPDLLSELVDISRNSFGWFTRHPSRAFEYPWIISEIPSLSRKRILDVGAGVSPLPLFFSHKGAIVTTIDNSRHIRKMEDNPKSWNEWGFLDYSSLDLNIISIHEDVQFANFESDYFDYVYSVSVIEHMPSFLRRAMLKNVAHWLRKQGRLILTIDLIPNTNDLWNYSEGQIVEPVHQHGTYEELVLELHKEGFTLIKDSFLRNLPNTRVDCAFLSLTKTR